MLTIDTHCHASLGWFEPIETLLYQMDANAVDKAVLVQHRGEFDNSYLLDCATANPGRFTVMGLVDGKAPDAPDTLAAWHARGVGSVRLQVSGTPDGDPEALWRQAAELGMPVSTPSHAFDVASPGFVALVEELSALPIVIEHYGFLRLEESRWAEGYRRVLELAKYPNVHMKIHGLGELMPRPFPARTPPFDIAEAPDHIDRAIAAFGADRLMLATDYPHPARVRATPMWCSCCGSTSLGSPPRSRRPCWAARRRACSASRRSPARVIASRGRSPQEAPMAEGSSIPGTPSQALYGSDLMAEVLRSLGIRYMAINPGASYRGLHDSLVNFGDTSTPHIILCTHEEIAVAMANGYYRATGDVMATGLHNVVGLQHAAMAIFNAWCDRTPILNLGGGGPQDTLHRRSTDWVHTALVQGAFVRDFVKHDDQPYSVEAVPEALLRSFRIATTAPKGPVYVCLDSDVQEARITEAMTVPDPRLFRAPVPPAADPAELRRAAELLVKADWPIIVPGEIGITAPEALPAIVELAEMLGCGVVDTGGPYNFPNQHPLDVTEAREAALSESDVVLALEVPSLGVPLGPSVREREPLKMATKPGADIIHITLHDLERQSWVTDAMWLLPVSLPIAAGCGSAMPALVEEVRRLLTDDPSAARRAEQRRPKVEEIHNQAAQRTREYIDSKWADAVISQPRLYREIDQRMASRDWALVGNHGRRWRELVTLTKPGHGLGGGRGGGVGYGLPSALGSALGYKDDGRLSINVQGDGDFLMTSNALWTAAHERIPLLTVIMNNHSYYNDVEHQERMAVRRDRPVENKGVAIDINDPEPDLAGIARALGVEGIGPITDPDQLGGALDEAIKVAESGLPVVVDVTTQPR